MGEALDRLAVVGNKTARMKDQVYAYYYLPQVSGVIKSLIIEAEKQGKDSVSIDDLVRAYEEFANK